MAQVMSKKYEIEGVTYTLSVHTTGKKVFGRWVCDLTGETRDKNDRDSVEDAMRDAQGGAAQHHSQQTKWTPK